MDVATDDFRTVDPFGFWPRKASALVPRVEADGARADGYVFHAPYILQGGGEFEFRGTFEDLTEDDRNLFLSINELGEVGGSEAVCVATKEIALRAIRENGGAFSMVCNARPGHHYAILGYVSGEGVSEEGAGGARSLSLNVGASAASAEYRRQMIAARQTLFDRPPLFPGIYDIVRSEPTLAAPVSQGCTVAQFEEPAYRRWLTALKRGMHLHRKQWEFIYILQSLDHHGKLAPGMQGLGFGVGEEPLPALMAAMGCDILATDLPMEDDRVTDWSGTGQHSSSLDGLRFPELVPDEELERHVAFRPVDMTRIPDDLTGYDFTWSSCALEHVGSIAAGLDFIERSIACLKPGGIAVHTTELNLLSNDQTLDHAGTVLFRRRDFEEIAARLVLAGHEVMPLNFTAGSTPMDDHIDMPPYSSDNHFKLIISRYLTTSFGIVVRRGNGAG